MCIDRCRRQTNIKSFPHYSRVKSGGDKIDITAPWVLDETVKKMRSRKPIPMAAVLCLLIAGACDTGEPGPNTRNTPIPSSSESESGPYGYISGIIEFRVRRPFHQVDETVYFIDWGNREARYETIRGDAVTDTAPPRHQITMINPKGVFTWQVEARRGSRSPLPPQEPFINFDRMAKKQGRKAAEEKLKQRGVHMLPPEMILGFPCNVFRVKGGTFWIHRGLVLRSRIRLPGFETSREAVRFVPEAAINPERLAFPPGVDPEEFPGLRDLLREADGRDPQRTRF